MAAGYTHTLATDGTGALWSWGSSYYGQVGLGFSDNDQKIPVRVGTADGWVAVAAALAYSLAIRQDGWLWAWGLNDRGQLGLGDTGNRTTPTRVGSEDGWVMLAAGTKHGLALNRTGALRAWGDNVYGQLRLGDTDNRNEPALAGY